MQQQVTILSSTVDDSETIVRALKTPYHFDTKKKKLKPAAFRPPIGESVISVMRQLIGDEECKNHAVTIGKENYVGLAALTAKSIRQCDSKVLDAPDEYYGHAHIDHEFPAPNANEPASAIENERAVARYKSLADVSKCHVDLKPEDSGWFGESLKIPV